MGAPEGILGQSYWQSVKDKQEEYATTRTGKWALNVVKPSILGYRSSKARQLRRTAYLDGLRGFAALLVYFGHHELWAHGAINPEGIFENGFGYKDQHYFVTLPGVRTFFSGGHFAVSVFFVISGYVLSSKPMQYIHAGDQLSLCNNLSSALFKRWIRLFLPVACTTFLYMCSWHLGVRSEVPIQSTFRAELWKWYKEFRDYSFLFDTSGHPGLTYSFHVWSIPTEFKGSIVVYTSLLAFSRARRNMRLLCMIVLMIYFIYFVDAWYCAMFIMGMLQCDLDNLASSNDLPKPLARLDTFKRPIYCILFAIGIYLGGCPSANQDREILREAPGWYYLSYLKPEALYDFKWFFLFWAATFTVASIPRIAPLKRFFECRFNQYLGRISFAFYLVHGPLIWTVADRLYAMTGCTRESHALTAPHWMNKIQLPSTGPLGLELNFLIPHLLILPITLWFAEVATRLFDEPSVKFAQWLHGKTLDRTERA